MSDTTTRDNAIQDSVIQAASAPKPVGVYPHARRVGDLLFLSGIGPRDPATNAIAGNEYFADGRVRELGMDVDGPDQLPAAYENALSRLRPRPMEGTGT